MGGFVNLQRGDPAPWFRQQSLTNPSYVFDTIAGRASLLCFLGSMNNAHSAALMRAVLAHRDLFDDGRASFFGVTCDPQDAAQERLREVYPGYRFLLDFDGAVGRLYGAIRIDADGASAPVAIRRLWVVLDPMLQVRDVIPFQDDQSDIARAIAAVKAIPAAGAGPAGLPAPVLMTPDLLDRSLCAALIQRFETMGSVDSGFMREVDGKTLGLHDPRHKRRRDHIITDTALIRSLKAAFAKRLTPLVERAFQFKATRMERYIVACYDAEGGAHFRAHRDNTTAGTAHRRFAVSVNLNDDFDGGEVSFPEFGPKSYKPPPGAALVFSCSLLHAVSPMRRGKRYAFLPFLYDEEAARLREANNIHLGDNVSAYDSGQSNQNPLPSENNQQ